MGRINSQSTSIAPTSFVPRGSESSSKAPSNFSSTVTNCNSANTTFCKGMGKSALNSKPKVETRQQRKQRERDYKIIGDQKEQRDNKELRNAFEYVKFGTTVGEVSYFDAGSEGAPKKTAFALMVMLVANAFKPEQLIAAYCNKIGTRFAVLPDTKEGIHLSAPHTCPSNSTTQTTPSYIPALSDIRNNILSFGQSVYNALPAWPTDPFPLFPGAEGNKWDDLNDRYWQPGDELKKTKPVPTTTSVPIKIAVAPYANSRNIDADDSFLKTSNTSSSMDSGAILSGVHAYQRWPSSIGQDERLKGLALECHNDQILNIYQLLDAFAPLISRKWGADAYVDQYEYSVLQYAMQGQRAKDSNNVTLIDPADPMPVRPQVELQNEVAQLFFNALVQINGPSGAQSLENFIRGSINEELATNPTLDKLSKFSARTNAVTLQRLDLHVPSLMAGDRAKLNTLAKWFVETTLRNIDPLFNPQLNIEHPDFRYTSYLSRDGTLMSIGAGFINQFPAKSRGRLTPAVLREVGLYSLNDLSPAAWPATTGPALIRFSNSLAKNTPGERLGSPDERMKSGLASLMAPELPKIRRMQDVKRNEKRFLRILNDRRTRDELHKQQSKDALAELVSSKYHLYNFGLEQLPVSDRNNLIRSASAGRLEVFVPRVILYEGQHADISYKAALTATSGLIIGTGSTNSDAPSDYYLLSEERSWGSPIVSKITEKIRRAGGVTKFVNEHHASFTSGVRFHPSNHTTFETPSTFAFATNINEIASVVSDLQSFPSAIHERFTGASPSQRLSPSWTEKIFHSNIFALGKFIIGMIPEGNCVIAVLDTAEMIALPAKTDEGLAEQGMAIATDALFCFTGMIKINQAQYLIPSVRAAFRYGSSDEFALSKIEKHLAKKSPETSQEAGVNDESMERGFNKLLDTKPEDLNFRTGISEFVDTSPVTVSRLPNKISVRGNTLNVPHNLAPKGLIQKSDGGPIYLVMALNDSGKRVSYLWNESERQMELQTDQWFDAYGHLVDDDTQILTLFTKTFPLQLSTERISDMLYNNKRLNAVRKLEYQSFFDHQPAQVAGGVHSVGDRQYIKLDGEFYLLEAQAKPAKERRIIGNMMPEDLRLDMKFDGAAWHVISNHLITPVAILPETVSSFSEALKQGFNLPEGWSTPTMYVDNSNPDQFVFSFKDKSGKTMYRHGPDRKNAFEELSAGEFEEKQCRVRRAPPEVSTASCSMPGATIAPLPSELARTEAIKRLVALDIETRPFYERPLLQLELVRDAEKIQNAFLNNPQLARHFSTLTTFMIKDGELTLPRIINEMKSLKWGTDAVPEDRLSHLSKIWGEMKSQLMREPLDNFGGHAKALQEICESSLKLFNNQRSCSQLKVAYIEKVMTLNRLNNEYEVDFVMPQQKVTSRLWKRVFGPVLTSKFTRTSGWTFEIRAKGLSQISETYGPYFADDISAAYSDSHELAENLIDWLKGAPQTFWKHAAAYFHVTPENITPTCKDRMLEILVKFQKYTEPIRMDKLRIISPSVSPDGIQYRYNPQEHAEGLPQEASLFGNVISAYTYEGGPKKGKLYLTTSTFLSTTNSPVQMSEAVQHEIAHLAITNSGEEIYLEADRSKYGHYSEGGLRRNADAILSSPVVFLRYAEEHSSIKSSFLAHFEAVLPSSFNKYFSDDIQENISDEHFKLFVDKVFHGPADEKIEAFMMPDLFVGLCQHMSKVLPKNSDTQAGLRHKRASPNDMGVQIQRLLVREIFDKTN